MLQGLLVLPVGSVVVLVEFYLVDLVHINARIMDPFSDSQYRRSTSYSRESTTGIGAPTEGFRWLRSSQLSSDLLREGLRLAR